MEYKLLNIDHFEMLVHVNLVQMANFRAPWNYRNDRESPGPSPLRMSSDRWAVFCARTQLAASPECLALLG